MAPRQGRHHQRVAVGIAEADLVAAGQAAIEVAAMPWLEKSGPAARSRPLPAVKQRGNGRRAGIRRKSAPMASITGLSMLVGEDQHGHAGGIGAPLPADLLVQPALQNQLAIAERELRQPGPGLRSHRFRMGPGSKVATR